jgi:surface carbohydrate biosynthesis protein
MRIQLLCDHKWRDLPNLTVTKFRLEQLGHRVVISTTKDVLPTVQWFRPDCFVINHLFSPENVALARALRACNVATVLLPTEGAVHPALAPLGEGEYSDFAVVDLLLAWGESAAVPIRERWGFDDKSAPITGFSRLDFYHPKFRSLITPRDEFLRAMKLDPSKPVVTWATAFSYAHLGRSPESMAKYKREQKDFGIRASYERIGLDPDTIPQLHARGQELGARNFIALAKALPDVQFIIRPHPTEDRNYYRALMREHGIESIAFCPQDYIWNVLNASDVHLHRHCTTAVEAWTWGKPTIEMAFDPIPQLAWPEREAGSDIAENAGGLIEIVRGYLAGKPLTAEQKASRERHIAHSLGPVDGRRSIAAADEIDRLLRERGSRRRFVDPLPRTNSPRSVLSSLARFVLSRRPDEAFFNQSAPSSGPEDKLISRRDVGLYEQRVAAALA